MNKIRSKKDASVLAILFQRKLFTIQLWDNIDSNRLIDIIDMDGESGEVTVVYTDTVNGTENTKVIYENELTEIFWHNRKFINQSGQLAKIDGRPA